MPFTLWLLLSVAVQLVSNMRQMSDDLKRIYKVRMNEETFEMVKNLHINWYIHAIKALFGQIGKQLYQQLSKDEQKILASCLGQIMDERDLAAGSKCLVQARYGRQFQNRQQKTKENESDLSTDLPAFIVARESVEELFDSENLVPVRKIPADSSQMNVIERSSLIHDSAIKITPFKEHVAVNSTESGRFLKRQNSNCTERKSCTSQLPVLSNEFGTTAYVSYYSKFRHFKNRKFLEQLVPKNSKLKQLCTKMYKQLIKEKNRYKTKLDGGSSGNDKFYGIGLSENFGEFPIGFNLNAYTKALHHFSKSAQLGMFWKERRSRRRWERSPHRLITNQVTKSDVIITDVKQVDKVPPLHDPVVEKSFIQQMSKLISVMMRGKESDGNWTETYKHITEFKKQMDQRARSPGSRIYDFRLFDLVTANKQPSSSEIESSNKDFTFMVFDFVKKLSQKNRKGQLNYRLLSPRLLPLMPDQIEAKERVFSPSIMSLYKDDNSDSIASLPKLLEESGMKEKDRKAVMEMVMDVSGARVAVEMALNIFKEINIFALEDKFFETTARISDVFANLEKSFNGEQLKDMNSKGYTFLEIPQMKEVLRQHGVKEPKEVNFDMKKYSKLDKHQRENALWKIIEQIAQNGSKEQNRTKRQAAVLQPTFLAPYLFSPIFGLTILGPVVLSPNIFSPLILNPSILGPFVLSPAIFMPFLISPYVLSPYVLTPILGAPFILNPYVLSPNIINPYILSPLILSPYIFCPDVLSPQALGGQILSPSAFSPSVFSESVLMASVLSPTWMSK